MDRRTDIYLIFQDGTSTKIYPSTEEEIESTKYMDFEKLINIRGLGKNVTLESYSRTTNEKLLRYDNGKTTSSFHPTFFKVLEDGTEQELDCGYPDDYMIFGTVEDFKAAIKKTRTPGVTIRNTLKARNVQVEPFDFEVCQIFDNREFTYADGKVTMEGEDPINH